jgi:hypothetical protein
VSGYLYCVPSKTTGTSRRRPVDGWWWVGGDIQQRQSREQNADHIQTLQQQPVVTNDRFPPLLAVRDRQSGARKRTGANRNLRTKYKISLAAKNCRCVMVSRLQYAVIEMQSVNPPIRSAPRLMRWGALVVIALADCRNAPHDAEYPLYSEATRQADAACGFRPNTVYTREGTSHRPARNVGLGCSIVTCTDPNKNPPLQCLKAWAVKNGYTYSPPSMCFVECDVG